MLGKSLKWVWDLIFPKHCLGCQTEGTYLCPKCRNNLTVKKSVACPTCGRRSPDGRLCSRCRKKRGSPLAGLLVAADWENLLLRRLIYAYKYSIIKELCLPLSEIMVNFLKTAKPTSWGAAENIIFIPVPLHPRRQVWRGFNQSELLAKIVAQNFSTEFRNDIVCRSRHTFPQMELDNPLSRRDNIKNAFALNPKLSPESFSEILKNKIVVLVDDVATTTATLEECARALKPLKPKEIWGLVIARG